VSARPLRVLRRLPRAAWVCMLAGCISAACWSFVTPAFQVPDEPDHFAYAQQLAETGALPTSDEPRYSQEEETALAVLHQRQIRQRPQSRSISSRTEQQRLQRALAAPLGRTNAGHAGVAASEPPLYYALETIPYYLGSGGTLLDRLQLMRLASALLAGLTALFTFLFVREALPGAPWAWTVGGLAIAFVPLLGFMSGAVNPDAMLYTVSAALFYCLARAFRRGFTLASACAIGAVLAIGLLTKVNFVGLLAGALLGLVLLARRAARAEGRVAYRWLALALAIGAAPTLLYALLDALSGHATLGLFSGAVDRARHHGSILGEISYVWQFYLPRLPGMPNDFPGFFTTRQIWFDGYVGLYGWYDTVFPPWVYSAALLPAALIALLCIRALVAARAALRERAGELLVYAAIAAGVMALVASDSYLQFPGEAAAYGATRYLLPMLPLLGAVVALAARGAGRRWGPPVGALIVVLFYAHDVVSQMQAIARYYG